MDKYLISESTYYSVLAMDCAEQNLDYKMYLDYPNCSHPCPHGPMPVSPIEHIDVEATNAFFDETIKSMRTVCELMDKEVQYHKSIC